VESGEPGLHWKTIYWGVVVVAILLVVQYLREVPTIPLWYLLKHPGSAAELVFLREDSFKLLDSPLVYFYDVLRRVGFPVLTAVSFGYYRLGRKRTWLLTFLAVTTLGVFFSSLSLAKMPVALIALVGCFYWYLQRGGRLSLRAIIGGVTLVLLFPIVVLMQLRASTEVSIDVILTAIAKRLFVLPAEILYAYFEIFPRTVGFLHGRTIGRVAWAMGEPLFDLSNYAFNYVFPTGVSSGSAPAAFIGFFYADFGLPGVLFGGFLAGVIMQLVHSYLIRRPKTVMGLAAYAFMYWAFWQINLAALPQTMLSGGVAFVLAGLWLFDLGERGLRRATAPLTPSSATRAG
jgi:oligosaccharide repeat unit polymerase